MEAVINIRYCLNIISKTRKLEKVPDNIPNSNQSNQKNNSNTKLPNHQITKTLNSNQSKKRSFLSTSPNSQLQSVNQSNVLKPAEALELPSSQKRMKLTKLLPKVINSANSSQVTICKTSENAKPYLKQII